MVQPCLRPPPPSSLVAMCECERELSGSTTSTSRPTRTKPNNTNKDHNEHDCANTSPSMSRSVISRISLACVLFVFCPCLVCVLSLYWLYLVCVQVCTCASTAISAAILSTVRGSEDVDTKSICDASFLLRYHGIPCAPKPILIEFPRPEKSNSNHVNN